MSYQEQCRKDEFLQERIYELIDDQYDPYKPANIVEAIYNECLYDNEEELDRLQELLEKREMHNLGLFVFGRILAYWEKMAERHAIEDWESGNRG